MENTPAQSGAFGTLLVVFGHEEVDKFGHGSAETLIRHVDREVERLALLIRRLHRWGYPEVHVVTDHGFILLDEEKLPPLVPCDKDWCYVRKERFALVPANADLPLVTFPFAWDASMRVALPPGLAFFMAEKSFSHGGGALQEILIPHLVSRMETQEKRVGVEVSVPSAELLRSAVKVVLRPKAAGWSRADESFRRDRPELCCLMYCAAASGRTEVRSGDWAPEGRANRGGQRGCDRESVLPHRGVVPARRRA